MNLSLGFRMKHHIHYSDALNFGDGRQKEVYDIFHQMEWIDLSIDYK